MKLLLSLFFICITKLLLAQHLNVESNTIKGNKSFNTKYIGTDVSGNILTSSNRFKFGKVSPWGKSFTPNGAEVINEVPMNYKSLIPNNFSFLKMTMEKNNPLLVFLNETNNELYAYRTNKYFELVGHFFLVGDNNECNDFYFDKKPSGQRTYLTSKTCKVDDSINLRRVTLSDQNNIIFDYRFTLPINGGVRNLSLVERRHRLLIAFESKSINAESHLFEIDNYGVAKRIKIPLNDNNLEAADISVEFINDEISITGQLRDVKTKQLKGLFNAFYDDVSGSIINVNLYIFEKEMPDKKYMANKLNVIPVDGELIEQNQEYNIVDRVLTDDKEVIYFIQKRTAQIIRNVHQSKHSPIYYLTYKYNYSNLLVVKTNRNSKPLWMVSLDLNQSFLNNDPERNFELNYKEGVIYILHSGNDNMLKSINTNSDYVFPSNMNKVNELLMITTIDRNGSINSDGLLNLNEKELSFNPSRVGVDVVNNSFLMFNSKRKFLRKNQLNIFAISF
jgi:hypothetical protein